MTTTKPESPRSLDALLWQMQIAFSPAQYDDLMDEWDRHPQVIARQAEFAARDAYDNWIDQTFGGVA